MPNPTLSGFYAALLTGCADDGAGAADRLRALCDHALAQDLDGLYVSGSTAEQAVMQVAERADQIRVVAEHCGGRGKRLIAHVGAACLRDAEALARIARRSGYDAVSALPPNEECGAGFDGVLDTYKAVIQASGLPLIVYLFPSPVRRGFSFEDGARLLALPGVVGMKFTSDDLYLFGRLRRAFPGATLFFGKDEIFASAALIGCDGGIGSTYNLIGGLYRQVHQAVEAGRIDEARRLQTLSAELVDRLLAANLLPAIKHVLAGRGVDAGPCRSPARLGDPAAVAALDAFVASGVLDRFLSERPRAGGA